MSLKLFRKPLLPLLFAALLLLPAALMAGGLSKTPVDLEKVPEKERDLQVLRLGMIAELDAVSLYEQLAAYATDPRIKALFLDIAREEKTHIGEFQALLLELDPEQKAELEEGMKEMREIIGGEKAGNVS